MTEWYVNDADGLEQGFTLDQRPANGSGDLVVEMEVGGSAELRNWVLSFGAGAEVLAPSTLRNEVAGELQRAAALYRKVPSESAKSGVEAPAARIS